MNNETLRELLELAAKASHLVPEEFNAKNQCLYVYDPRSGTGDHRFAPNLDNGDAFLLSVRVFPFRQLVYSRKDYDACGGDNVAATRMAILKAAAEVGRAMK